MGTVTISAVVYQIYGTQAAAIDYHNARLGGEVFTSATSDNQKRALVSATRWIDRLNWMGAKTSPSQPLEFPRTGLIDCDGTAVDSVAVPLVVEEATYELALVLLGDAAAAASPDSGTNIKRLKAGSAEIEYFVPTIGRASLLPTIANELLHCFFGGSGIGGSTSIPFAGGTCHDSQFEDCDDYGLSEGYK